MKKSILISVILLIILSVWTATVSAASISVSASNTSPKIGNTVTITVRFSQPVTTASFKLNYNNSIVQYVSDNQGGNNTGSSVKIDYIDVINLKTISSVTFSFKVKSEGTAKFTISGVTISDADGNELSASTGSATITVKSDKPADNTSTGGNTSGGNGNTSTGGNTSGGNNNTSKDPTFKSANQKVYVKSEVNVRSSWTTSSSKLGTLAKGDSVTRIGIGSNGWDKVSYQGKTGYILTSYLTTTEPKKEDDKNTTNNTISNETTNNTDNSQTNNETNNEVIDNNNEQANQETSVTPEQKNNPNYVLYAVGGVIGLAIVVIIIASIVEKRKSSK